ncbi:ABC transporter ATP-binding protein [Fusibacter sp. JL298sf-3]
MNAKEKILEVKDLEISFNTYSGKVRAVRGLSFDLYRGETIAIVGESGSGKSVTNKTIMGILSQNANIDNGSIIYDGNDLTKFSDKEFNRIRGNKISMIFQDPMSSLDPVMKIGKQITEALIIKHKISKAEAKEKALKLMTAVGIPQPEVRYNQYPFQFSGGMRQRIVIATALACDPELLICDEPTTALDVTIQAQIIELIKDMQSEKDLSVIFITHDLGVVANVADRVAVMYAGKIVEYGTVDEIFYDPKHPYTWALLASMPDLETDSDEELMAIPGTPPNMLFPPKGDAFAARNKYAMKIDFEEQPPFFKVTDTHYAATWLLHPDAPKVEMPAILKKRIEKQKERMVANNG